jgi:energy-coupling factor transporter ATP-binding protein EcfA2
MLIILEGPDGSGKSTLAQALATALGRTTSDKVEVWHRSRPSSHPLDEYLRPLYDYRPGTGYHLILDRWHWGEAVYPKILGRRTDQDAAVFWAIEAYLRRLGALVVHCDRNYTFEYLDLYRERGLDGTPDSWQITQLQRIRDEFVRMIYRSALPTYAYVPSDGELIPGILESARHYEEDTRPLNDFITYTGSPKPHTLLLGDVRNLPSPETDRAPAFVPTKASSGHYLLSALTSLTSRDWVHRVGIANTNDVDDVTQLHDALGRPRIVALGKLAYARVLTKLQIPCSVVPHPQYVRRFHNSLSRQYAWQICVAANPNTEERDYSKWPQSFTPTTDEPPTSTSSTSSGSSDTSVPVATVPPVT